MRQKSSIGNSPEKRKGNRQVGFAGIPLTWKTEPPVGCSAAEPISNSANNHKVAEPKPKSQAEKKSITRVENRLADYLVDKEPICSHPLERTANILAGIGLGSCSS